MVKHKIILKLIIILDLFIKIFQTQRLNLIEFKASKIKLKIKGQGNKNIFGYESDYKFSSEYYPTEVYINEKKQDLVNYSYYFGNDSNSVELILNNSIQSCWQMFRNCIDIIEVDLSNFNSSEIININSMFCYCSSLTSVNLNNFDTSKVTDMGFMFYYCNSLTSIDLSSFNTSKLTRMLSMFEGCESLEFINLKNFDDSNILLNKNNINIFKNVPDNIVIYINENNSNIISQIKNKTCYSLISSDDWISDRKTIIDGANLCNDTCYNNDNISCYENCINIINKYECKCRLNNCLECSSINLNESLCTNCKDNYYPIENDTFNLGKYINCYKEPIGYYLDKNISKYKKCYDTCESCEINGDNINHNCIKCNINFSFEINITNNYKNCYENCSNYYYFDNQKNFHCTNNKNCPDEFPFLEKEKTKCAKHDFDYIIEEIGNIDKNETEDNYEIKYYDEIMAIVESIFMYKYDTSNLDNSLDESIEVEKIKITLSTTQNQKNNTKNNITLIDIGECETLLRKYYNLSDNQLLYMKKIDIIQDGIKIPKIYYDIYAKLSPTNLTKLNLSICQNCKIYILIPYNISENIDVLNISSGYYNDICYVSTSKKGTDIILKDRKQEYIDNNMTICQEDCDFSEYNYKSQIVNCSCKVNQESYSVYDMHIDMDKILKNFKDIKNIANLNILSCYKILFSRKGISNNIGALTIIIIIIIHFIFISLFYSKSYEKIICEIKNIKFLKLQNEKEKNEKNEKKGKMRKVNFMKNKKEEKEQKQQNIVKSLRQKKNHNSKDRNRANNNKLISQPNYFKCNPPRYETDKNSTKNVKNIFKNNIDNIIIFNESAINEKSNIYFTKGNNKKAFKKTKFEKQYSNEEMNKLPYQLALQYDKRTFCEYYISLLKIKHVLIFTFCNNKDYNSIIIKIDLFLISIIIYVFNNTLFFNDDTMHKIYEDEGQYNFVYQLPKIIYSLLISLILNSILKLFALSGKGIYTFKNDNIIADITQKEAKLKNQLKIKFIAYFIISSIFLLLCWYYISMFCAIYKNTQKHLISDTLLSLGLSLTYPFIYYLLPGFFRIPALSNPKNNRKYLYIMSTLIQII